MNNKRERTLHSQKICETSFLYFILPIKDTYFNASRKCCATWRIK